MDILVRTFIQMDLGMSLECRASTECLATHLATIRTNTSMSPHVQGQTVAHSEPHATHRARIGLLPCMNAFMLHFVMRSEEAASTETTLIRSFNHVRLDVSSEKVHVCKYFVTVDARVLLESSVDAHVHVEMTMFTEGLVANLTVIPQK